jgi:glutamate-ammonia-ligase adenylyltransferase
VRRWHHGRYRATRSERSREKLTTLIPVLLKALGHSANPDQAFLKFDDFLGKLPAGVQLFSLFLANPGLLDLVAEIMGTSPHLADILSRHPNLLDAVISGDFYEPLPDAETLAADLATQLTGARDFQDVLDISRRWANERKFQCGVQVLRNTVDVREGGAAFTRLAETLIRAIVRSVGDEFAISHGRIAGAGMAVIAMGKLGGMEMTSASDLDLIFVYDFPDGTEASDGDKPLAPSQYFGRLSQRVINAITAMTPEGQLYEVDMRLRPSGRAGPLAIKLDGFQQYQSESAWTWEHMALTRARVIDGPAHLEISVEETIDQTLRRRRDPGPLALDVDDMRLRLHKDRPTTDPWSIKYVRGGLVDAEFICQFLQLRHGTEQPGILVANTYEAFSRMAETGVLNDLTARSLIDGVLLLSTLQGLLRLCTRDGFNEESAPEGLRRALIRAGNAKTFDELRTRLISAEADILAAYDTLIAEEAGKVRTAGGGSAL